MSRSRRHSPFVGHTTADSDAAWKAQSARKTRRLVHQKLSGGLDGDALPAKRYALTGPWDAPKDGKQRLTDPSSRFLRK
ncbi:hypothetical protein [Sphingomonas sp.]|jgi:hypothetical protein|uniref:hypothetical protein n=1 Tax=Sphingomonas sp. TaxID=28214 RepID=UPI002EDA9C93